MTSDVVLSKVQRALLAMQRYSWEQGVTAQAFFELGDDETTILLVKDAVNRQAQNGQLALMHSGEAYDDPAANGEALLHAARLTGDSTLKAAADRMLDYLLNRCPKAADGTILHMGKQVWIDAMYMSPPYLAAAGQPVQAVNQIEGFRKRLYNPHKKMYAHMWDEDKNSFARSDCWGVGNGWTAAGLTRVIHLLPAQMNIERQKIIYFVRELIDACLIYQRPDGLFHNIVDNPSSFVETNLAQMLAYSIYRGSQRGWLDESYLPKAEAMRQAARKKVDQYGLVQGVCGSPEFDHAGTAPEGQAFFILMEAARRDLNGDA